ncbi:hypothetical protein H3H54_15540 [Brachybacterium sp. Z12]|uniref:hypothetical protein n=1 Tax=Brachybacterium sp. Z12 TaxID=2759167 RepID=UPI00185F48CF|nr:hypothetical protein [Brachybacterium sp. Z12]QNN82397.1 hypothetical protein H3H54_15540 [Brachybacterium sp. Z12]
MPRIAMHQSPPHLPPHRTAPTEQLPERSPRTSFYMTVGCLSVIVGLLLGVGGFFGVRALQDDGEATPGQEQGGGGGAVEEPEPQVLDETPVGPDAAVPSGSTFPSAPTPWKALWRWSPSPWTGMRPPRSWRRTPSRRSRSRAAGTCCCRWRGSTRRRAA